MPEIAGRVVDQQQSVSSKPAKSTPRREYARGICSRALPPHNVYSFFRLGCWSDAYVPESVTRRKATGFSSALPIFGSAGTSGIDRIWDVTVPLQYSRHFFHRTSSREQRNARSPLGLAVRATLQRDSWFGVREFAAT
ncbi:unnamed protein product [Pieris brassicae]|uniref:Uncharacterized protein n=1 Tax=Pieris brassicae TaxID=7116 RepID=A0A9P0U312_PIEBR|nr:unnamed protein product [Pieris brassicae]